MASSTISRSSRSIRQTLFSLYTTHHLAPLSKTSPPSAHLFHSLHNIPKSHFNLPPQSVICPSMMNPPWVFGHRYLSVGTKDTKEKPSSDQSGDSGEKANESSSNQSNFNAGKDVRGSPVSWTSFVLLCLTGVGVILFHDKLKKNRLEVMNNANKDTTEAAPAEASAGKASVGGPFNLVNHEGKSVTEKDFKGKWTLMYFGFTHCPDICPDELLKLAAAIDMIKEKGFEVVPVFISVDPERDTVQQIREYIKEFHPDLIGLTGSPDEIKKAARAYRVYYMKTQEEDSDYLVDHSIVMYLMDPEMEFVKFFGKNEVVDTLAEGIMKEITNYQK